MWEHDAIGDYLAAGPRRLADAWELLESPTSAPATPDAGHRHLRGAAYLAGYAVECALKAYIISRTPPSRTFVEAVARRAAEGQAGLDLSGRRGHSLGLLLRATDLLGRMDPDFRLRQLWGICLTWTPAWRYHPKPLTSRRRAQEIVKAAAIVAEWVNEQRRQSTGKETS